MCCAESADREGHTCEKGDDFTPQQAKTIACRFIDTGIGDHLRQGQRASFLFAVLSPVPAMSRL